ncbi:TetR/AcrR family transcriptional regulator [Actinomycetospora sp. TBRC 11914]|uniref:TetR/AcrR family transcriptional regulator n=1 Tax=Actinomycetospora sp. TBRC 11914 TaxID=2729387 RepID=UPI00145D48C7|nr:TetR/AcrR family transcriptional regulator [Actinomycetospora sp. TBRC 11914]NMO91939.1 TetR/AcrR family transcriptional regulator [Actinomycetospora sp. TBRC 11914]
MARTATPVTFFDAALRLLAGPGLPALRIGRLCGEVGVTSGSFYHHFGSWDGFVAALLDHWAAEEVDRPLELVRRADVRDPGERVTLLKGLALTIPHDAETAIRRWAGTDTAVAAAQQRVDDGRRDAVREVIAPLIADPALVAVLAEVGLSLLVGHQQLHHGGPPVDLSDLLDQFELLVRSHADTPARG